MTQTLRISLAQLNATVGDLEGNARKIRDAWQTAKEAGAALVAFPEMFITGYQTQDLIKNEAFVASACMAIATLARDCADGPALAIGGPLAADGKLYNAYYILKDGVQQAVIRKHHLPHHAVFDEMRLFDTGEIDGPFPIGPLRIGFPICEDAWHSDVPETLAETGADLLLVPNGSPYHRYKQDLRLRHMHERVQETGLPLIYLNMVGGQDDQVFDGASFALNIDGEVATQLPAFSESVTHLDLTETAAGWRIETSDIVILPDEVEQDYQAICLGLRDYLAKSGFSKVVIGMSGGIDSALVAAIAADAIGAENLRCVMLPSEYTSRTSFEDAETVIRALGCRYDIVPIDGPRNAVETALEGLMAGTKPDITEENIQSRLRGILLMAISNKFGEMLLTTGNKSEVAVGYSTIYGDMCGGYNPLKDMYKTRVFETCRWRNTNWRDWMQGPQGEVIAPRIITKPPSAELRPDQKDEDSLPPYHILDEILEGLIEHNLSVSDLVDQGFEAAIVKRIQHLMGISEWKRHQAAPGPRISPRAFWLDRRYPIVNRWRDQG